MNAQELNAIGVLSLMSISAIIVVAVAHASTGYALKWVVEFVDGVRDASLVSIILVGCYFLLLAKLMETHLLVSGVLAVTSLVIIIGGCLIKRW